jgi:hypothetical protein
MARVPVVIVHIGDSYYLRDIVEMNASKNPVIFVGCEKNAYLGEIPNVKHICYKTLEDSFCQFMREHFLELEKGYDTTVLNHIDPEYKCVNNGTYQFLCFLRVYYVKKILEQEKLEFVFHVDSDCILLENTNTLATEIGNRLAYSIEHIHDNIHMVGSIHNALLNVSFCNRFLELYTDIYANKSKRHLLREKIDTIASGKVPGNICDMNLYYLLWKENLVEMFDLTQPFFMNGEMCVFDHNIHNASGFFGANTYKMTQDSLSGVKVLYFEDGKIYQETIDGRKIRLLSIHFNDCAKKRISSFRSLLSSQ